MLIGVIRESRPRERRVSLTPDTVRDFIKNGHTVIVEKGAGLASLFSDDQYVQAGATLADSSTAVSSACDVTVSVHAPTIETISAMKRGTATVSMLYLSGKDALISAYAGAGASAFALEAIPRISRAQKMDVLSSQNNLAGYKAVIMGANALGKIFPMLMTAAGTVKPSRVLIMGAGVAGLQAVATAKRMGAIVEVSDVRPETKEQVQSLGGSFIELPPDESVQTGGGYVTGLTEDFLRRQQELVAKHAMKADLVITTALVVGRKAPILITDDMVKGMQPGSVIVDMATEQGGNCALSKRDETIEVYGVTIVGESNIPSTLPINASQLFAKNIYAFITDLATTDGFKYDLNDEITAGALLIHNGTLRTGA